MFFGKKYVGFSAGPVSAGGRSHGKNVANLTFQGWPGCFFMGVEDRDEGNLIPNSSCRNVGKATMCAVEHGYLYFGDAGNLLQLCIV